MYGETTKLVTGSMSTVAGITALPDTGSNPILIALTLISIAAGAIILCSFGFARVASLLYRK